jgi:hypothetical protein
MIDCVFFISLSHYQAAAIVEYGGCRFDSCPRNYMALKKYLFCLGSGDISMGYFCVIIFLINVLDMY